MPITTRAAKGYALTHAEMDANLAAVQALVSGAGNSTGLNNLDAWFRGGVAGKSICLTGDSTTLDTSSRFISRLQYFGACIKRPFTGNTVSRSGANALSTGVLFFQTDIGASLVFADGTTTTITAWVDSQNVTVANSGTVAAQPATVIRNAAFDGNEGSPLAGVTVWHCGDNGASAQAHIGGSGSYPLSYVVSLACDLYLSRFLINDVRLGNSTQADMQARLETIYDALKAAKTGNTVMMGIPNTLLSTDPGSTGYVVPLGSAQDYSDRMAGAYRALYTRRPGAYVWDTRKTLWGGDTCPATSGAMNDILHPGGTAQDDMARGFTKLVGQSMPFSQLLSDGAFGANQTAPWTTYPRAVEDSRYFTLIATGLVQNQRAGSFDIVPDDSSTFQNCRDNDIFFQDGITPFVGAAGTNYSYVSGVFMRVGITAQSTLTIGKRINIYRFKGYGDPNILVRYNQPDTFPWRLEVKIVSAGNSYIDVNSLEFTDNRLSNITTADTLCVVGQTAVSLATASAFTIQSATSIGASIIRISISGSYAALSGGKGYLFGAYRSTVLPLGIPAAPTNGQIWYDGTNLLCRLGGVTKTITAV